MTLPLEVDLSGARILVGGAGVLGSAAALAFARAGARVVLADPAPLGLNASGIAAGMLAPAFETALDGGGARSFEMLRAARDHWPGFLEDQADALLHRSGALYLGDEAQRSSVLARLQAAGAEGAERGKGVFSPEDWRIEPIAALAAMRSRLSALGGAVIESPVKPLLGEADLSVLACGYASRALAPELALLRPIKGQLLRFAPGILEAGPMLRSAGGYLVPSLLGAIAGATMEEGRSDLATDPSVEARLAQMAAGLAPGLKGRPYRAAAGVRAATPDGLPLAGWSTKPKVLLAAGARRNGWLLAPLIARTLVELVGGGEPSPFAAAFAPSRFNRPD